MSTSTSIEILDLRHFASPAIRPVLEAEGALWMQRLHWDYRNSARLLTQYIDSHTLPGYAAIDAGRVAGYAFCVYEASKAVIGDVFAMPVTRADRAQSLPATAIEVEETLLRHLLELLVHSPQIDRIESQLLLHPSGSYTHVFQQAGFQLYRRLFMVRSLRGYCPPPSSRLEAGLELRPWHDGDIHAAAQLISTAYYAHPDSVVNDQYRTVHGSLRFLNNIVRFSGCGSFSQQVSHVVVDRQSRQLIALVLGSCVSPQSGHITQICVHPSFRRRGLARMLLRLSAYGFQKLGVNEISLTVTEANNEAIALYIEEGYTCVHSFDASVWQRPLTA